MTLRKQGNELIRLQLKLRQSIMSCFNDFSLHSLPGALKHKTDLIEHISQIKLAIDDSEDKQYYQALEYFFGAVFFLLQSYHHKMNADSNAENEMEAAHLHFTLYEQLFEKLDKTRPSNNSIYQLSQTIKAAKQLHQLETPLKELAKITLPVTYLVPSNPYRNFANEPEDETSSSDDETTPTIISVSFYFGNELWANPQIVKPAIQYPIRGTVRINSWPQSYTSLLLKPVSTTNDEWFILSLPEIGYTSNQEISINGSIVFKYAQSTFDAPVSIRLFAQFVSSTKQHLYADIIGYDQLIVKILDNNSFNYPTGYNMLNEKVLQISLAINEQIPDIDHNELDDFLILLSSILNYQGYCYQHAEYKNVSSLSEDIFRDQLIKYLSANPRIGSQLVKEGHLAGGRVEINYRGIIAELKVENTISERDKLINKYKKQPVAYATATSKRLSILCILDMVQKKNPPALAGNNVFLVNPVFHGFETIPPEKNSLLAVIIIDANMPSPSGYNK